MSRLGLILIVFIAAVGFGQTELSLGEAINRALTNNFDIRLVKTNVDVSETQNSWGMAGASPEFSINVNNNTNLSDNSNNPASFFPGVVLSDNFTPSVDMSWTVFQGFGIRINKKRLEQIEEQTKGNAIVIIESTIYDVIIAYYTAVVQDRKKAIIDDLLRFSTNKLAYFEMKSDLGVGNSMDALEFKNLSLSDSSNLLLQELSHKNALRNLNLLMGEDVDQEYLLTDSLEIDVPHVTYEELKSYMIENNQNLKNQYINSAIQELNRDAQKSFMYPMISLNLGAAPALGYIQLFGDDAFSTATNSANYYATVSARYTLFNGFQRKRNLEVARMQTEMAELELNELSLSMSHNLTAIFDQYQTQSKVEDISLQKLYHTQLMWDYGKDQYDQNQINVFGLNDIRVSYLQAQMSYYDMLFNLVKTHYDLYRLTGRITQEYKVIEELDK